MLATQPLSNVPRSYGSNIPRNNGFRKEPSVTSSLRYYCLLLLSKAQENVSCQARDCTLLNRIGQSPGTKNRVAGALYLCYEYKIVYRREYYILRTLL